MDSLVSRLILGLLAEPRTRGLALDDPRTTILRRELAKNKRALNLSYLGWYRQFVEIHQSAPPGARVELGSGGGFLDELIPGMIKTDLLVLPFVDVVCRAEGMPFVSESVGAIFMANVLHHMTDVRAFFAEAQRILVPGGVVAMIEPYVSPFSRFVYKYIHHEPFDTEIAEWALEPSGPLSGGNDALPWNIFVRDRKWYDRDYPNLPVEYVRPHTFLSHLLTGGVTMRSLTPARVIPLLQRMEARLDRHIDKVAAFATVVLRKAGPASGASRGTVPADRNP